MFLEAIVWSRIILEYAISLKRGQHTQTFPGRHTNEQTCVVKVGLNWAGQNNIKWIPNGPTVTTALSRLSTGLKLDRAV